MLPRLSKNLHKSQVCLLIVIVSMLATPVLAQTQVGQIRHIEKPPTGASEFASRELVRSVEVFRQNGPRDFGYKDMPLQAGDGIAVRSADPRVYRVIVGFTDPTRQQLKIGPGRGIVYLAGRDSFRAEAEQGFLGWVKGKVQATTKYVQAIAPGTEYGLVIDGERARVFVWEGEVRVTNLGPNPLTVAVTEKRVTDVFGPNQPSQPRVPKFEEVRELVLFGLDLDPVIRATVTDERLRQRLHEDLIRALFESRVQRSAVAPQINLANAYLFLGKTQDALSMFDEAERISPRPAAIFNGRGVALTQLGQYAQAADAFNQALSRDRDSIYYNNRGNLLLIQGSEKIEQALSDYDHAIRRDRTNAAPLNGRAVAFFQRNEFLAAEANLNQSLRLRDRAVARSNLGNLWLMQNRLAAAEAEYARALQFDPQDATALHNRGVCRLKQQQFEQARDDFAAAIEADPRQAAPRIGLGLAYIGLNRIDEAVTAFISALQPDYTNRTAYRNLAYLFISREQARNLIQQRLQQMADIEPAAQAPLNQFIRFLETLPSVPRADFDRAFDRFQLAAR
ncbi:MAG: tetratricopeptide repeat protein [Acidobacteriota bacterium]|nr:tetratricopeptide repeat protein [Acidobacteriota bacterium]